MPYTYKSLALAWVIVLVAVALSGSGMVMGSRVLWLVGAALAAPLVLTRCSTPLTAPLDRALAVSTARGRAPMESSGLDVYRWENEGGARRPVNR